VFQHEERGRVAPPNIREAAALENFSLLGGPLYRLGCRLGLVREGTNTTPMGLALGGFLWIVLVALSLVDGVGKELLSLSVIAVHVRLLVTIPLFFLCEWRLDPHLTTFVRGIIGSGVVAKPALPVLDSDIARAARWRDAWLPEAVCLLAAVVVSAAEPRMYLTGTTVSAAGDMGLAADWYWIVCITLFRFLIFRWLWRLGFWWHFLWRVSRLELNLMPTHPDRAAGLGYLEIVHRQFAPLILAVSAFRAAAFAAQISTGAMKFQAIYPQLALILIVYAVVFLGPLCVFIPKLKACREKGYADYMEFAARFVSQFDKKWVHAPVASGESLLSAPDPQSLSALDSIAGIVPNMRLVPVSRNMAIYLATAAVLPMLPLILLAYPFAALATKVFEGLLGL
jgi:hypothetical protein